MQPTVELYNRDGDRVARVATVREIRTVASFGAMNARCWIQLWRADPDLPQDYGYSLKVQLNDAVLFQGELVEQRTATQNAPFVLYGERDPERLLNVPVNGLYLDQTISAVLAAALAQQPDSRLTHDDPEPCTRRVDRLHFLHTPLTYAIDLLAKLAGNRLWDIDWDWRLRWRPTSVPPDHVVYYDARWHTARIWETSETIENSFAFHGGPQTDGHEYVRQFEDTTSVARVGRRRETLFVRAISTDDVYGRFRNAILAALPFATNERFVDFHAGWTTIQPGDQFALRNSPLVALDDDGVFRAKTVEHTWRNDRLHTRVHLAGGLESASRFTRYCDHDARAAEWLLGPFQLDVSALDGGAHLDP